MRYYPALLDLHTRRCCIVGGGAIACRKARSLFAAGARVEVISPDLSKGMASLVRSRKVIWRKGAYQKRYIRNAFLVIAATSDPQANRRVSRDAIQLRLLANIVDRPSLSSFIVPAVLAESGLIIAISTSGKAPSLSKRIKDDLRKTVLKKYVKALGTVSRQRRGLLRSTATLRQRKSLLTKVAAKALRSAGR
jgi:siroheme synthase-like protein